METRRHLLGQLALGLGVIACRPQAIAQPAENAAYVGVETSGFSGLSKATFFGAQGERLSTIPLDFRAHGLTQHKGVLAVFPRRPGDRFSLVELGRLEIRATVTAPEGRHFYGHGAFTVDGKHLLVPENDLETLQGAIAVYDVTKGARRLGHIELPGAGPHDIMRVGAQDLFHIALGGLETHPAYGRTPLNASAFRSQTLVLDFASGQVTEMGYWPGTEGISLRHLAQDTSGRLYAGGQVFDEARAQMSNVLWLVDRGNVHRIETGAALGGYVSSVSARGQRAIVSSKTSGAVLTLDGAQLVSASRMEGASAVGLGAGWHVASGFDRLKINGAEVGVRQGHEFDNHGMIVSLP